ncbi:DEAD/DEAH box helicase, putative [Talaromyces stipitatus ATCC 10500]|uniref:DEAD/DEAH box helicase, putative n=1 Tax=Talaromyces stipitatus (strain ATCC 10500 / CBS 375.48 / QM 6759 / NRRL 1006) TaxID=441959 RepID=B8MPZ9_TALSN|nr:DEAD/DEAH box helicase, putative [Talaromyces stipitatus ATCC 10500]EED12889.1 DEAD/DEAH box helicase, putative [Talaromyces stipitatus ATCC 10500]
MGPKSKGNARGGGPKPGTKQAKAAAEKSAQTANAQQNEGEAKKPTVKQIIGGASWTGKLPVNLLSEHCQKQKWEKPEYTMTQSAKGFVSSVILSKVDPKTKEKVTLPSMQLPPARRDLGARPTALEARHFAAIYALYRVCNMRNMSLMLPPDYRKLWKDDFPALKAEATAEGKAWMYEADPFLVKQQRDAAAADMEKKKTEQQKLQAKAKEDGALSSGGLEERKSGKGWSQAPKIELGTKIRRDIEDLLRYKTVWNPYGVTIPEPQRKAIIDDLSQVGFRRSHVKEAVAECKDREEVLEWLLLYVPEDDLPSWSLPEGYSAGISLASGDLVRESKIKRLAAAGYPSELCARTLDNAGGNEALAAEKLQMTITQHISQSASTEEDEQEDAWAEEAVTLEAIFGDRYKRVSKIVCEIQGEVPNMEELVSFRFQKPTISYPTHPPIISVLSNGLPAYIRLSAVRQAIRYATEDLIGTQMIFSLVDWLETNLPRIVESPGPLRDISTTPSESVKEPTATTQLPLRSARKNSVSSGAQSSSQLGITLRKDWESKKTSAAQIKMNRQRQSLPAWAMQESIIQCVNTYQVTIISGETGSGKSTQSVQFILDDLLKRDIGDVANIVCTQPRRISALSLADRVSDERCSTVGDEVGYIIRGGSKVKSGRTKITFMTTGVLLRRLQTSPESSDDIAKSLVDITHVVVDEVHERSLDTDFLLALLRDILNRHENLKVILMSATLDADIFMQYFGGPSRVGRVNIPGRTFPVEDYYVDDILRQTGFNRGASMISDLDDAAEVTEDQVLGKSLRSLGFGINYDLIVSTVRYIDSQLGDDPGGILIFLPGTMEIDRCLNAIRAVPNLHALPLHASLLPAEQKRVFNPAPKGKRKVIAATNVAETSITIDDVVAVIDTGRVKETSFDPKDNVVKLQEVWASQAACKQRRGRAGRVKAGKCYKLFTRSVESNMAPRPDPEIRRVPLEQLCLSVVAMNSIQNAADFLAKTLTPPETIAVEGALSLLHSIGALDNNKLTALGRHMSMIPADLRCAKLMVYGSIFGCVDACITIASILIARSPFVSPRDKREEATAARAAFSRGGGDLLTDLAAYQQWSERSKSTGYWQSNSWCSENFLSHQTLREISSNRAQLLTSLKDAGILPIDYKKNSTASSNQWDRNSNNTSLLQALIAGSFNPQIAQIKFPDKKYTASMTGTIELDPDARTIKYFNLENGRVFIHPSSVLFSAQNFANAMYISYFSKMETSKVFIRELTPFNAYSLLLFAGSIILDTMGRGLVVDGWLRLRGWARIGVLISRLRMMLDDVLAARIDNPSSSLNRAGEELESKVIELVTKLVDYNGLDQ